MAPGSNLEAIDTAINGIKTPFQLELNRLYMEPGMKTLEARYAGVLANRSSKIDQATLYTQRESLALGLSWLQFPEEPVAELLANTRAIFVDLRPQSGVSAVDIQLHEFDYGGYGKSGKNRIVIQRAENTSLPSSGDNWNDKTKWKTSLVAVTNDEDIAPVIVDFKKPNKNVVPGKSFVFNYNGNPVESPLIVAVPLHENFATHSAGMQHEGVSMYCGRVVLLVRQNQKETMSVEPSPTPIAKIKGDAQPKFILPRP
ncbi:hypothetical protein KBD75_02875 [Candidatus Woesebacteria bacterium]|nr:hypothetical protein [Candidatus Woesebacteria bacterium]